MLKLEYSTQFKKDFKKIAKLPIPDIVEVGHVIKQLQLGKTLWQNPAGKICGPPIVW